MCQPPPDCQDPNDPNCQPPPDPCQSALDACLMEGNPPELCTQEFELCKGQDPMACFEAFDACLMMNEDPAICEAELDACLQNAP